MGVEGRAWGCSLLAAGGLYRVPPPVASPAGVAVDTGLWRVCWLLRAELAELRHLRAQRWEPACHRGQDALCCPAAVTLNVRDMKLRPDS